jgi:hypothetical protein
LSWVYCFFDFVEKTINPTRKRSVREPGSLTHPLVTPIEGISPVIEMITPSWSIDYWQCHLKNARCGWLSDAKNLCPGGGILASLVCGVWVVVVVFYGFRTYLVVWWYNARQRSSTSHTSDE